MLEWSALVSLASLLLLFSFACTASGAGEPPPLPDVLEPYPVVGDIAFAEGPVFDKQGNLYFVNYLTLGTLGRRTPDGTVSVWVNTGGQRGEHRCG